MERIWMVHFRLLSGDLDKWNNSQMIRIIHNSIFMKHLTFQSKPNALSMKMEIIKTWSKDLFQCWTLFYYVDRPLDLFTTSLNVVRMCLHNTVDGLSGFFCYALLMIMCLEQKMLTLIYFIMSNNLLENARNGKMEHSQQNADPLAIVQAVTEHLNNIFLVFSTYNIYFCGY